MRGTNGSMNRGRQEKRISRKGSRNRDGGAYTGACGFGERWDVYGLPPYGNAGAEGSSRNAGRAGASKGDPRSRKQKSGAGQGAANSNATQNLGVRYEKVREELGTSIYGGGPLHKDPGRRTHYYVEKTLMITPQDPQGRGGREKRGSYNLER